MIEGDSARRVGGVGTFGFADLANFGLFLRFSHVKTVAFRFWCLVWFAREFSLWFSVFVNVTIMAFFLFFFPMHFPVVLVCKGSYTLHSRKIHDKPGLFSSRYLGHNSPVPELSFRPLLGPNPGGRKESPG